MKEQDRPDVKEAIEKEFQNMSNFGVFGEKINWTNQEIIGTRMIEMESEKHDGQKTKIKARLVEQGFKKTDSNGE